MSSSRTKMCWVFVCSWYEQSDEFRHWYSWDLQGVVRAVVRQDFRDWGVDGWSRSRVRSSMVRDSFIIMFFCT